MGQFGSPCSSPVDDHNIFWIKGMSTSTHKIQMLVYDIMQRNVVSRLSVLLLTFRPIFRQSSVHSLKVEYVNNDCLALS